MASPRRLGAETSKTRGVLLDAGEQLMLSNGYAAVTSRSRQVQLDALAARSPAHPVQNAELAPDVLLFFATIPKMLLMEEDIGLSSDPHAQVLDLVNQYIEGVETSEAPRPG